MICLETPNFYHKYCHDNNYELTLVMPVWQLVGPTDGRIVVVAVCGPAVEVVGRSSFFGSVNPNSFNV